MEKAGLIRRSNSPWASPLHLVPKKDGSWRPCGNYRRLNAVIIPLPNMQSFNDHMEGCTVFFKSIWSRLTIKSPLPRRIFPAAKVALIAAMPLLHPLPGPGPGPYSHWQRTPPPSMSERSYSNRGHNWQPLGFYTARNCPRLRQITPPLTGTPRRRFRYQPLVPRDLCWQVFDHLHRATHPGTRVTRHFIASRYVWKGLSTDVSAWQELACTACRPKYTAMSMYHRCTSRSPHAISATSTWIWWVPWLCQKVSSTCSSWTGPPASQKRHL
jgi:hypothetical protein